MGVSVTVACTVELVCGVAVMMVISVIPFAFGGMAKLTANGTAICELKLYDRSLAGPSGYEPPSNGVIIPCCIELTVNGNVIVVVPVLVGTSL